MSNSMEWNLHPGWIFHRHSAKFLIRERASQRIPTYSQPIGVTRKKKTSNDSTWSALYRNSPKLCFLFAWKKSHGDDVVMSTHQMNFSRRSTSLWRKAAKCYFVLVLSSCGLFQKSHLVTGFFSQPFLRCVKILHGCTSHTKSQTHKANLVKSYPRSSPSRLQKQVLRKLQQKLLGNLMIPASQQTIP